MNCRDDPDPVGIRPIFDGLLDDDSFPRAGAALAANSALLTVAADNALAALLAEAQQRGDNDRATAISQYRAFVARCRRIGLAAVFPPGHPAIDPTVVSAVAADMRAADDAEESYDITGDFDSLTAAAAAWRRIMTHPSLASAYPGLRAALLNNAGGILLRRYWAAGSRADLADALETLQVAVALTPPRAQSIVGRLCNLGLAIREVYRQGGDDSELERAIGAFERAAEVADMRQHAVPTALTNLALGLQDRYLRSGNSEDLGRAISCCEQACRSAQTGAQVMLGDLLRRRYASTGERPDLERAVALLRSALQATPDRSPERPRRLVDLGIALLDEHAESGDPSDLSAALRLFAEAVQAIPMTSPDRPGCLVHRSLAFHRRYQLTGAVDDLERAVDGLDEAVRTTGAGCVDWADWTVNLAAALQERARRTGSPEDLDRAISILEAASVAESGAFDDKYAAMNDLGNALRDRYHATGSRPDLDRAVLVLRAAVAAAPPGTAQSATLLANLGAMQRDRYALTRSRDDLDEAIIRLRAAVENSPPGHADRPRRLFAFALAARDHYDLSRQAADLDTAVDAYRRGCADGVTGDPASTLVAAQEWGAWATARHNWTEAATAYRAAIAAELAVVQAQVIREHKETWLRDTDGLASCAAYASAMAHQLPAAVAAAEAGRAAILSEALQRDHLDLRRLAGHRPDLAARYLRAGNCLRRAQQQRPR
jgi:tetratricopeptide (TPR) repeat protein